MNLVRLFFICTCLTWYFLNFSNIFQFKTWNSEAHDKKPVSICCGYRLSIFPQLPRPAKATCTKSYFYIVRNKTLGHCPSFSGGWILKAGLPDTSVGSLKHGCWSTWVVFFEP